MSKHFLNTPGTLVQDALKGLEITNSDIKLDVKHKVVYLRNQDTERVALISGGGSGHEPAHSGFVGNGMLSAAVCGNIFASPNPGQVLRALELVNNPKGTVIIVKNYTGDILNFGLAREKFSALYPDQAFSIRFVVVADDVAVGRSQGAIVGRRGLAGTVLVYKIAAALAKKGGTLDEVEVLARCIASRVGTIGVGLGHCHVPGTQSEATLKVDEYEIGMGIHNEPGHRKSSPIPPLNTLVEEMVEMLTSTSDPERSFLDLKHDKEDCIVLMVNNLGGTSELELAALAGAAVLEVKRRGFVIDRILIGTFMTSLNMPGVSLTLLLLPRPNDDTQFSKADILRYLDEETDVLAWKMAIKLHPRENEGHVGGGTVDSSEQLKQMDHRILMKDDSFIRAVKAACKAIHDAEPEITSMDQIAGDGDCGLTLKTGADAVSKAISEGLISGRNLIEDVRVVAQVIEESMDGTSGALYSIFFSALAKALYEAASTSNVSAGRELAADTLKTALDRLYTYTRARPPSRTLIDPLDAFIRALNAGKAWKAAALLAGQAAESTKSLPAKVGRAAYVEQKNLNAVCDPGAWSVKTILEAACSVIPE
ncbi:Dihydroxyacetone kinase 2 [Serendipita sp. 396]|nr:Dihydroxyacetone kinase 2 [Serendipita sp. 396]KAG8788441.1 Dihydroxyacetone kinase 2 [Serendipita sp. 397]KAG8872901.1 Dihydroxyacetone kinase 2 [Serendipita sp. 405]